MNNKDIIEKAETNEIICRLIYECDLLSITKIMFTAFSIKNMDIYFNPTSKKFNLMKDVYNSINYGFQTKINDIKVILQCIEILEDNGFILVINGKIKSLKRPTYSKENIVMNSELFRKTILDIKKLSDQSFIKGVIENV